MLEKKMKATETEEDRCSQLGLTNSAEFIFYSISGVESYLGCAVCPSYTPSITDLFLLENLFSNSQVIKRLQ